MTQRHHTVMQIKDGWSLTQMSTPLTPLGSVTVLHHRLDNIKNSDMFRLSCLQTISTSSQSKTPDWGFTPQGNIDAIRVTDFHWLDTACQPQLQTVKNVGDPVRGGWRRGQHFCTIHWRDHPISSQCSFPDARCLCYHRTIFWIIILKYYISNIIINTYVSHWRVQSSHVPVQRDGFGEQQEAHMDTRVLPHHSCTQTPNKTSNETNLCSLILQPILILL